MNPKLGILCLLAGLSASRIWGQSDQLIALNDNQTMFQVEDVTRIGLGTASPIFQFELVNPDNALFGAGVIDPSSLPLILRRHSDSNLEGTGLGFGISTDQTDIGAAIAFQKIGGNSQGRLYFSTKTTSAQTSEMNVHLTIDEQGEVGIGTIAPTSKLTIRHNGTGSNPQLELVETGSTDYARLNFRNSNTNSERWTLSARTSAAQDTTFRFYHSKFGDLMSLDVKGFVGIGTVVPETKLHIKNGVDTDTTRGGFLTMGNLSGLNMSMDNNEIMARNNLSTSTLHLQAEGGDLKLHDGMPAINEVIVKSNGNVGLGTVNPDSKLSVKGQNHQIEIIESANNKNWTLTTHNDQNFGIFEDASDPRLFLEAGGQIGIGTTAPIHKLHLRYDGSDDDDFAMGIRNNSGSGLADGLLIKLGPSDGSCPNNNYIRFEDGTGTGQGYITGTNCGSNDISYSSASDRRLKTNIRDLEGALPLIREIKPRFYSWKQSPHRSEFGFIAQELMTVLPQVVVGEPDSNEEMDPMAVDYGRITPVLVGAIQELLDRIEGLEDRIDQLEQTQNPQMKEDPGRR